MQLKIGQKICGDGELPLMFAEEGQANQGNFDVALHMVDLAVEAGADGIEFQLFLAADMYARGDKGYQLYADRELSFSQVEELILYARKRNILFQAACLSPKMAELCAKADVDAFCINATDLNNPIILDAVSALGKPFWLATLMANLEEIDWAVEYLNQRGAKNFGLLHGQHVMSSGDKHGVPPEIAQLDCIRMFKERYGCVVGYVDHSPTLHMPSIAVAKEASIVMKHLSPQADWKGPDWVVCLPPSEWKKSKDLLMYAALTKGQDKSLSTSELKDRTVHRRSLYTTRAVAKGEVLSRNDLTALRPSKGGMDPREISRLIGKKAKHDLTEQSLLQEGDLE